MSVFTVTERQTWKRCRRQHKYASLNRMGLTSVMPGTPLVVGTATHAMHRMVVEGAAASLEEAYAAQTAIELQKILNAHASTGQQVNPDKLQKLMDGLAVGSAMAKNYEKHWGPGGSIPEGFILVQNEQQIIVPVPGTMHCTDPFARDPFRACGDYLCVDQSCDCKFCEMHFLEGSLDALLMAEASGLLFVLERKTFDRHPSLEDIQQSDQLLAYIWILTQIAPSLKSEQFPNGFKVGGAIYDGMWKRAEVPKGRTFDELFLRCSIIRPDYEIEHFTEQLAAELNEMGNPNTVPYPNRRSFEGCYDCSFEEACTRESRGDNWEELLQESYVHRKVFGLIEEELPI